jgi:sigma-B regulation protein RsbU (phosphoserine phosphatase)
LLAPDGIALGLVDEPTFSIIRDQQVPLHDGDVVVLYTDGVIEAMDEDGSEYGQERLFEILRNQIDTPAEDLLHAVTTDIRAFARGVRPSDDVTLVVLKFDCLAEAAKSVDAAAAHSNREENRETV